MNGYYNPMTGNLKDTKGCNIKPLPSILDS